MSACLGLPIGCMKFVLPKSLSPFLAWAKNTLLLADPNQIMRKRMELCNIARWFEPRTNFFWFKIQKNMDPLFITFCNEIRSYCNKTKPNQSIQTKIMSFILASVFLCTPSSSPHSWSPEISFQPQSSPSRSICYWWEPLSSLEGSTNLQHQVLPLALTPYPQDSRPWSIKRHLVFLPKLDTSSTGCICWWWDLIKGIEIASQQTTLENATITFELVSVCFVNL